MASNSVLSESRSSELADVELTSSNVGEADSELDLHKAAFHGDRKSTVSAIERGVNISGQDMHGRHGLVSRSQTPQNARLGMARRTALFSAPLSSCVNTS